MRRLTPFLLAVLTAAFLSGCASFKRCAYEGFNRDEWQQPERVIEELSIEPGMQVADVGAGGGYFTFMLADAVGKEGRVYAVDIDDDMIEYLRERARDEGYDNVTVVRGDFGDPLLPDGEIDLVFTSNTYHHIDGPVAYFAGVRSDLSAGGRLAIVELAEGPLLAGDHFTEPDQIAKDMEEAGYELLDRHDFIDEQSFQVFRPATDRP